MSDILTSFSKGDFSSLANSFTQAGFVVQQPHTGIIQICAEKTSVNRLRLLISVGIHGDETAPIEMIALLLEELSKTPKLLAVDLMIAVGNLEAIKEAKRFIDVDLNRLFVPHRTTFNTTKEAQRADQLMQAVTQFFDGHQHKWHLDLHTAIRASKYPTFAIVPGKHNPDFVSWLGAAGIKAVVLSPLPSVTSFSTFSSFTCAHLGAISCTAELGRIAKLGKNDLSQFATTRQAINALLRSEKKNQAQQSEPHLFRIVQELIKHSHAFQFTFDSSTQNFTEFSAKTILATDGEILYSVGATPECVLFPNPDVHIGLRAGLMIVPV
jgi:succinylglutamate desuccinylase